MNLKQTIIQYSFWLLSRITPKNKKLVIFTQKPSLYTDNSKALFEYITHQPDSSWQAVWLYRGKPQRKPGKNYLPFGKLKAFIIMLRAGFVASTSGPGAFQPCHLFSSRTKFISLWHGIPIKSIRFCEPRHTRRKKRVRSMLKHAQQISLLVSSSKQDRLAMSCAFQILPEKVIVSGLPRNDHLIDQKHLNKKPFSEVFHSVNTLLPEAALSHKTILYVPTFRECPKTQEPTKFFPFADFNAQELVNYLKQENAHLLLRPHPSDRNVLTQLQKLVNISQGYIHLAGSDVQKDINEILPFINLVITDYSSIYIDSLLTNTPCIFVPYDYENYNQTRTFLYDYDMVTPGPKVNSHRDFMNALSSALTNGAPEYQEERDRVKKMFHAYTDGQACQRVLNAMQKLLSS